MSYNKPLASTTKYGVVKVGSNISVTNGIISAGGLTTDSYYGKFFSDANQTNTAVNTAIPVNFPSTTLNSGITTAGTNITFTNAGIYTITYEVQAEITSGGGGDMDIWCVVGGTPLVNSNSITTIPGGGNRLIINRSFLISLTAGQVVQVNWSSSIANMQLTAVGTQIGPVRPATNSANFLAVLVKTL